ncbi:GGDEF domain-containing protein [Vibrio scophthalmi]|uniref:sensor domain-containing diguanylate cyclase n=1 Tax=Vibrio scophthalmi TaxID=45658 RepID=UPI002FF1B122
MRNINIDASYGIMIVQDLEPVYLDENYAQLFGYSSAKELMLKVQSIFDLIAPRFHDEARANYYLQIKGCISPKGRTYKNIDRYGNEFTALSIDHLIEWEGKPAIQVTVIDLSVLEEAQQRLKESEEKYKKLVTTSGQGISIHRNFHPILVNQAWVDLMRAPSIDYVLKHVHLLDFIPKHQHDQTLQRYNDILKGRKVGAYHVVENICFDGEKRYFNIYDNLIEWDGEPAIQAVLEDVTEKVELENELKRISLTDAVTQTFNRHHLNTILNEEMNRFERYEHPFSVILVDLDNFKLINDKWGHNMGDDVLISVAKSLQLSVRKVDEVGRWGGEEFLVICTNTDLDGAAKLAEKLRSQIEALDIASISITASFGVATVKSHETIKQLLARADHALYQAKHAGRNSVYINHN